ncbi:MAG: beta-lactamase family protein [Candidatus Cloacimonetes bacterium]|nr:beta-lactamase family protein [Candidatus Cloacimonadota bacterium]
MKKIINYITLNSPLHIDSSFSPPLGKGTVERSYFFIITIMVIVLFFTGCAVFQSKNNPVSSIVPIDTIDTAKLDSYFDTLFENNRFMGSIAISHNNELLYTKSVGFLNADRDIKANIDTKYRIGSVTKTFTAVLVLKAVEENKLNLQQTIEVFFPEITNAEKITIENLLRHRSGIPDLHSEEENWVSRYYTEQELVSLIASRGSDFEPDSKFYYSNPNHILLGFILQRLYEKTYAEILDEKIVKPLELKNTYVGNNIINILDNEADSFNWFGIPSKSEEDMSILIGTGSITSTPVDLTIFGNALFNGKLISSESLNEMREKGMSLGRGSFNDNLFHGHHGAIGGFYTSFCYFPEKNIAIVWTSNDINFSSSDIDDILRSAVFDIPYDIPDFEQLASEFEKCVGVYLNEEYGLTMNVSIENYQLFITGSGIPFQLPLQSAGKDKFDFSVAFIAVQFNISENTMILKQGREGETEIIFMRYE